MPAPKIDKQLVIARIAELFREYGYHGTSYAQIMEVSGLGKGSLYHYFPNGKEAIAKAVLEHIHQWFENNIFIPLQAPNANIDTLNQMFDSIRTYFLNGKRICLVGAVALYDTKDFVAEEVAQYFRLWLQALKTYFINNGLNGEESMRLAASILIAVQGGLVLTRATENQDFFLDALTERQRSIIEKLRRVKQQ